MASIGQLGGLAYQIPRNQPQVAQGNPFAQEEVEPGLDVAGLPEGLASRRKALGDLIDRYSLLKTFSQDMAAKGIDVFSPNSAEPGGGLPFQALQNLYANVQFAKQNLLNQQKRDEQLFKAQLENKAGYASGVDPQEADLYDPSQIISYEAMAATKAANERLDDPYETQGSVNAANTAVYQATIRRIMDMPNLTNEQKIAEIAKIQPATLHAQTFAPQRESASKGPDYLAFHKNLNDHTRGNWDPSESSTVVHRGKSYSASDRFKGSTFGYEQIQKLDDNGNTTTLTVPKKVRRTLKDSKGNVFFEYESPDLGLEQVSNQTTDALGKRLIEGDNAYGGAAGVLKYYDQLEEAGELQSGTRSTAPTKVFGDPTLAPKTKPKPKSKFEATLRDQWDKLTNGDLEGISYRDKDGNKIVLGYNDEDGVHVVNYEERGIKESDRQKNISYDDYLKQLDESNFFSRPQFSERSKKAVEAFEKQRGRKATEKEINQIRAKYN